jgi:hypothetical protein
MIPVEQKLGVYVYRRYAIAVISRIYCTIVEGSQTPTILLLVINLHFRIRGTSARACSCRWRSAASGIASFQLMNNLPVSLAQGLSRFGLLVCRMLMGAVLLSCFLAMVTDRLAPYTF